MERNCQSCLFVIIQQSDSIMAKGDLNEIINSGEAFLFDFSTNRRSPCKVLHPILQEVAKEKVAKTRFIKIDKDKNPNATARFNLRYAPSMILFKNEEIKCRQSCVVPLQNSLSKMKKYA
jgi:thioredoxin 1